MPQNDLLTRSVAKCIPQKLADAKIASGKPMRVYWGIDPTGARIHLGHAVPLRKMKALADAGHHVILLIGSFTAMIGDPTGKDAMRTVLTRKQVEENFKTYKQQAEKILDFSKIEIRHNHEWLEKLMLEDVIGLASHFTVQQMLQRDMFERRMEEKKPISVHEFIYPLMVGYDSVVLDVDCEIGGTDQEFNMLAGRTLQTAFGKREKFVLTTKLLEGTDGRKMSKTYDNCVYLDDAPKDMYGKLMRIKDDLILTYMECATDIPMGEIEAVEKAMTKGENPKTFKMRLAKEVVAMYHGTAAAESAEAEFQHVFAEKGTPDDMPEASMGEGTLVDLLLEHKLIPSRSEARRLIEQGGIHLNDEPVTSLDAKPEEGIVRVGKRKFLRVVR
jgi:tyrosyl-tRNA synthetase